MPHPFPIAALMSRLAALAAITIALLGAASQAAHAQAVVALVNGEAITASDVEQRSKLFMLITHKTPPRQEVIDDIINDMVKIKEGKKFGMELTAAEVDNSYAGMAGRMRLSAENFTKVLANGGVRPDTLKLRLKADTIWSSLVRGRFSQSLLVGDKDVESILNAKGEATQGSQAESFEYLVRQVVLVVPRGSAQSLVEQRRKEAEALRSRIQSCEDAVRYFQSMRDGTIREPLTKTSADLPQNLRELLDKTPVGQLTPPEVTKQGIEMVALCNRKPTTADTPAKREARDKLYAQKYEAKSKAYLQDVRKASMIEYR